MWFLQRFTKDEILVINENDEFLSVKQYLQKELESVEDGTAKYIGMEQLDSELESTIRKYDDL